MTTQQVTFADFVVQTRKWQKQMEIRVEAIEKRQEQQQGVIGMMEETIGESESEIKYKLANMSEQLEQTNSMISELLDDMPEDETYNEHVDRVELTEQAGTPAIAFFESLEFEGEQTE